MLGKPVPDFSLASTGATPFRLSSARGKKPALHVYPKDNTPGGSREAVKSHENFKSKTCAEESPRHYAQPSSPRRGGIELC
jgi:peroxiredoxin